MLVRKPEFIAQRLRERDMFIETVMTQGRVVYENQHARVGRQGGGSARPQDVSGVPQGGTLLLGLAAQVIKRLGLQIDGSCWKVPGCGSGQTTFGSPFDDFRFPLSPNGAILLETRLCGGNSGVNNSNEKDLSCASATVPGPADLKAAN
jgi:hypothetical protein